MEKRFTKIFDCLCSEDYGTALTLICPLIDGAGKKLYGIKKPGERFKKVLSENNSFLYWMISNGIFVMADGADIVFSRKEKGDINLGQAIYKLVRNSLLHEAELSEEIEFVDSGTFGPQGNKVIFPKNLIWALVFMLSYLECYKKDSPQNYQLSICGQHVPLNKLWGSESEVRAFFSQYIFVRAKG